MNSIFFLILLHLFFGQSTTLIKLNFPFNVWLNLYNWAQLDYLIN